ncbi:MAG: hypothetical protein LBJ95_00350 [Oscillospiraceae bacterium]|nr:hypothetical protein [Oscillospiraceae bacterium]
MKKREKNLNTEDSQMLEELAESDMEQVIGGNLEGLNVNSWKTLISPEVVNQTCIYRHTGMRIYCYLCEEYQEQNPDEHTALHGRLYSLQISSGGMIVAWEQSSEWKTTPLMPPETLAEATAGAQTTDTY